MYTIINAQFGFVLSFITVIKIIEKLKFCFNVQWSKLFMNTYVESGGPQDVVYFITLFLQ